MQHFGLYKLLKSKLTNILCLVRFGSDWNKLMQLLIRSRNSGGRTIRSLVDSQLPSYLVCRTFLFPDLSLWLQLFKHERKLANPIPHRNSVSDPNLKFIFIIIDIVSKFFSHETYSSGWLTINNDYFFKHNLIFLLLTFRSLPEIFVRRSLFTSSSSGSCHGSDVMWQENGRTYGSVCSSPRHG